MKRSKNLRAADAKIDRERQYAPLEAVRIAKDTASTKFDSTVEVAFALGVDPRKADQMVRGTVNLPHGTGKTARVLVFATGDRAAAAEAAGADIVGADELIDEVAKGRLDFDAVVATPDLMGKVGRLGRVLGPRGLMPNPKTGTVTPDVVKAVNDIKGGKIEFRVDKHSNLHFIIGKTSFDDTKLVENYGAALEEILRLKPSAAKGRFIKKATLSTTMGPSSCVRERPRARQGCSYPRERRKAREGQRQGPSAGSPRAGRQGRRRTPGSAARAAPPLPPDTRPKPLAPVEPGRICSGAPRSRTLLRKPKTAGRCRALARGTVTEGSVENGRPAQVTVESSRIHSVELRPGACAGAFRLSRPLLSGPHHPEGGRRSWQGPTRLPR